jgi:hypothetical protein
MKNDGERGKSVESTPEKRNASGPRLGAPSDEPGQPSRRDVGRAGAAAENGDDEAARIAQQQAATQRGYSADSRGGR